MTMTWKVRTKKRGLHMVEIGKRKLPLVGGRWVRVSEDDLTELREHPDSASFEFKKLASPPQVKPQAKPQRPTPKPALKVKPAPEPPQSPSPEDSAEAKAVDQERRQSHLHDDGAKESRKKRGRKPTSDSGDEGAESCEGE